MFVIVVVVAFDTVVSSPVLVLLVVPLFLVFSLAERQGSSPVKSLLGDNALLRVFV